MKYPYLNIVILSSLLAGCSEQHELRINAEHIDNTSLHQQLKSKLPILSEQISMDENGLVLTGDAQQVEQILNTARHIDRPSRQYYLIISNFKPGTIATNKRQIKLLINAGHTISLGEQMLTNIPWEGYQAFPDHNLINVYLSEDSRLELTTSNTRAGRSKSFQASLDVEPEQWYQLYGNARDNALTTNNEQLWVRLNRK